MARYNLFSIMSVAVVFLAVALFCRADDESTHHKVIVHVPFKIHTIHHHSIKKIPIYHYIEHRDHHHHHHHHEDHHEHIIEDHGHGHSHGWD